MKEGIMKTAENVNLLIETKRNEKIHENKILILDYINERRPMTARLIKKKKRLSHSV